MKYSDIIYACDLPVLNEALMHQEIKNISIDTRTLIAGDIYVAIIGEFNDGHDYVAIAKEKGAIAVIVSRSLECDIPQILVPDTTLALGKIAAYWRKKFSIPIVAITGSVGKTTTRNMLASIFIEVFGKEHVLLPEKNFNNQWGLPLVLSRLNHQHKIAILEMGMNHLEEIRYLMNIAQPSIGAVINAGSNHIGFLGSLENIAKAKGELFEALPFNASAILNAEDRFFSYWQGLLNNQKPYTFGFFSGDVSAKNIQADSFTLVTAYGEIQIARILLGRHNILNALAAATIALAAGVIDLNLIKAGLEKILPEQGRLQPLLSSSGVMILNDTYNGGKTSTLAALQVLSEYPASSRKIAVIGDMTELGEFNISMHKEMGEAILSFKPDLFIAFGPSMRYAYDHYSASSKYHFLSHDELAQFLKSILIKGDVVLLKGARAMAMEKILNQLM